MTFAPTVARTADVPGLEEDALWLAAGSLPPDLHQLLLDHAHVIPRLRKVLSERAANNATPQRSPPP